MQKTILFLVGPSGSGKSTVVKKIQNLFSTLGMAEAVTSYSWDQIRIDMYAAHKNIDVSDVNYSDAFTYSIGDGQKEFDAHQKQIFRSLMNSDKKLIIIDNVNATRKTRNNIISNAGKNVRFVGIEFLTPLQTLIDRQSTRGDKCIPVDAVERQYNQIQGLMVGTEVEKMIAHDGQYELTNSQIIDLLS